MICVVDLTFGTHYQDEWCRKQTKHQISLEGSSVQILKLERNVNCAVMSGMEWNMCFLNILTHNMQSWATWSINQGRRVSRTDGSSIKYQMTTVVKHMLGPQSTCMAAGPNISLTATGAPQPQAVGCPGDTGRDKSNLSVTLLDYMDVTEKEVWCIVVLAVFAVYARSSRIWKTIG